MHIRKVLSTCLGAALCLLLTAESMAANSRAMEFLEKGYAECKSAHLLRRKDFTLAKETYAKFVETKNQALAIAPNILNSEDPEVTRIISYCDTVGIDISRTEALPIFQEGVDACTSAAELVRNNDLGNARRQYDKYVSKKDEAIALSGAITEVFSVSSEIRRCDRVLADIETAQQQVAEITQSLKATVDHLLESMDVCNAAAGSLNGRVSATDAAGLDALRKQATELKQELAEIQKRVSDTPNASMLNRSDIKDHPLVVSAKKMEAEISACQNKLEQAIGEQDQAIAIAQQKIKAQEELAKQQLTEEEPQVEQETAEERQRRLERNANYYVLVKKVNPVYPELAVRRGKTGYVLLEFNVTTEGDVVDPVVIEAEPGDLFTEAAIDAVKQWQYQADFSEAGVEPDVAIVRTKMSFALN